MTLNSPTRSYPFSFIISSANTWTQISITIAGDTTGTWGTTNSAGICLNFSMGSGSSYQGSAGAWVAGNKTSVTGEQSVVGTNGATFYITGVQLEKGSTATSFDYRPYGTELQLCQRYYEVISNNGVAYGNSAIGQAYSSSASFVVFPYRVTKRANASVTISTVTNWIGTTATNSNIS